MLRASILVLALVVASAADAENYICDGFEPSWRLDVHEKGLAGAEFSAPDVEGGERFETLSHVLAQGTSGVHRFIMRGPKSGRLEIIIDKESQCDTEGGKPANPARGFVLFPDRMLSGCCSVEK